MWLFCFAVKLGFLVETTRDPEENLHNIISKRVQSRCIKLVTVTIWSDMLLPKLQNTRRTGN